MKLAPTLLASILLCSCSPLSYHFTEGTPDYYATDAERQNAINHSHPQQPQQTPLPTRP